VTFVTRAFAAVLAAGLLLHGPAADAQDSSAEPVSPKKNVSIGVAPFERVGDVDSAVPDVAVLLSRRLSNLGVQEVVDPRRLGAPARAEAEASQAQSWAAEGGVETLVLGRVTGLGSKLSVDARVLSGATGLPIGRRFFVEISKPRDLSDAVDRLAGQVVTQINESDLSAAPMVAAAGAPAGAVDAPEQVASVEPAAAAAAPKRTGFNRDAPMSIKANQLDARTGEGGGRKHFVFTGNVRATQAGLRIRGERLEAFYPPGNSQPEKIVVSGNVRVRQGERLVRCDKATFYRADDSIVCEGDSAEVEDGCDLVRGQEIEFHTETEVMKVKGAADVRINPACGEAATAEATP